MSLEFTEPQQQPRLFHFPLEQYVAALQSIPIVHKVDVLYDDRPDEVSIRVEYIENLHTIDQSIVIEANNEITRITTLARVKDCKRLIVSYLQKEIIL